MNQRASLLAGFGLLLVTGCLTDPTDALETSESTTPASGTTPTTPPTIAVGPPFEVCDKNFVVSNGTKARALLYCATGDVQASTAQGPKLYPGYRRLVIAQHGRGGDARKYYNTTLDVAKKVGSEARSTFIIAPEMFRPSEIFANGFGSINGFIAGYHFEWGAGWAIGDLSIPVGAGDFSRSSYDMLDQLIAKAVTRLPDLQEVVIVGHSAGGQLVNRYAATSVLTMPANVNIRYLPMNAQSWLYLDETRPFPELALDPNEILIGDPPPFDLAVECPDFNTYHTGLEGLAKSYFVSNGITAATVINRYKTRRVTYLVGENDTDDPDGSFICEHRVQGINRNERGHAYFDHVTNFYAPFAVNHRLREVPGAGHSSVSMFGSPCGKRWIFDDPNAVCL